MELFTQYTPANILICLGLDFLLADFHWFIFAKYYYIYFFLYIFNL